MKHVRSIGQWCIVRLHILLPLAIFVMLLARNPFSLRTLIPNLEPYPDSIHYINPALSFLHGEGLYIVREGRKLLPSVPPLYSFALMPAFLIHPDARMFYFVNITLSLLSFFILFKIVRVITPKKIAQGLLLTLFVTNYTLYWFPALAMAENLIVPLVLLAVYFLITPMTRRSAFVLGAVSVTFYATKFASLPLSVAVPFLFLLKLFRTKSNDKKHILFSFMTSLLVFGALYNVYEFYVRGSNVVLSLLGLFWSLFSPKHLVETAKGAGGGGGFFSLQYAPANIHSYTQWLLGSRLAVLWKTVSILPRYLIGLSWLGLIGSVFSRKRWISLVLLGLLLSNLFFMMTFYAADGRYFIIAIPAMILGVGLFLRLIDERLKGRVRMLGTGIAYACIAVYVITALPRLKFDIMLNLKYAETPWYYISIRTFDEYVQLHKQEYTKEPVIISALPPYLVDFYAHEKFILLPLDSQQEFRTHAKIAWGEYDYAHLVDVYAQFLREGHPVFLTQYGLGNEKYLHVAFDNVKATFEATEVVNGCYNLCSVYRLELKPTVKRK